MPASPAPDSIPIPLDSNIFPVDSRNRVVLPLPVLSEHKLNISLPTVPAVPRVSHPSKRSICTNMRTKSNAPSRSAVGHQRNVSNSSYSSTNSAMSFAFDSDDNTQYSAPTTPSSSRSSSPCQNESTFFRLIRRDEPFPPNFGLSDITAEDALVFYPNTESSSRAILLLGPAIARHLHMQKHSLKQVDGSGNYRTHRYRITPGRHASMCRDADRAMLLSLKKQLDKAKREDRTAWNTWATGGPLDWKVSKSWEQRRRFGMNRTMMTESPSWRAD